MYIKEVFEMFNQLYIQTEYSILQSSCKLEPLFERLVKDKVESCAIVEDRKSVV